MAQSERRFEDEAGRTFGRVLSSQEAFALAAARLEEARAERDDALVAAAAFGFPRRALAQATDLTPGRVQQIVDAALQRPTIQPALRMDRERRQRSQQLAEFVRRGGLGQ
jgi:hypothetical protein